MAAPVLRAVARPRMIMGLTPCWWGIVFAVAGGAFLVTGEQALLGAIAGAATYLAGSRVIQREPHFDTIRIFGGKLGHFRLRRKKSFWQVSGQMYEG